MLKKMDEKREIELDAVKQNALANAYNACLYVALPVIVNIFSFIVFVALGGELTATKAFTSLTLFELLQQPMTTLPKIVQVRAPTLCLRSHSNASRATRIEECVGLVGPACSCTLDAAVQNPRSGWRAVASCKLSVGDGWLTATPPPQAGLELSVSVNRIR